MYWVLQRYASASLCNPSPEASSWGRRTNDSRLETGLGNYPASRGQWYALSVKTFSLSWTCDMVHDHAERLRWHRGKSCSFRVWICVKEFQYTGQISLYPRLIASAYSIIGKTTPKHFLFWMFDWLLHVFWSHLYSNRSSDMLETLTLNKKMTFAAEDHFTPVLCCTVFSTSLSNCSVSSSLFPLKVVFSLVVELVVRLPEPLPNSSVWNAYPNVLHFFDCLGFFLLALSTFSSRSVVFRFLPHLVGLPSWLRCSLLRCGSSFGSL